MKKTIIFKNILQKYGQCNYSALALLSFTTSSLKCCWPTELVVTLENLFVILIFKIMKLQTMDLEMYGMAELSLEDQLCINGEYSWNEFCGDVGYGVGSCVAYATNAADLANKILVSWATDTIVQAPFRK